MSIDDMRDALGDEICLLLSSADAEDPLVRACVECDYDTVLESDIAGRLFRDVEAQDFETYAEGIPGRVASIAKSDGVARLHLLALGVTLLNAFLQVNYTGPALSSKVDRLIPASLSKLSRDVIHGAILDDMIVDGERPYPLVEDVLYLYLATKLLNHESICALPSRAWWRIRANFIHQKLLDDPVSSIHNIICDEETIVSIEQMISGRTELRARWHLELAHYYSYYSYDQKAMFQVKEAQRISGLHMQVSGALGRRTKFQKFDVSQLVVLARSAEDAPSTRSGSAEPESEKPAPKQFDLNDDTLLESVSFSTTNVEAEYNNRYISPLAEVVPVEELSPELASIDPGDQPQISLVDQCVLLSYAGVIKVSAASDDQIIIEQVAAYIARVLHKPIEAKSAQSNWTVNSAALLARTRVEGHRSRTIERSVLQLQALVDQLVDEMNSGTTLPQVSGAEAQNPTNGNIQGASFLRRADQDDSAPAPERLSHLFCLPLSSKWDLQTELASRYTSIGLVRSALEIFERLEKWDQVALCYGVMDQEEKAERVLREQLELAKPGADLPKLWCLLGDVTRNPEHWETSWDVSKHHYARAQRSLGKYHFSAKDYDRTIDAYARSLKINPLNHGAWFIYGCAGLETQRFEVAAEAFTRCVSIDATDGESWNNLASSLLRLGRDRRRDAWKALKTATNLKFDSWRMWENYMLVSLDLDEVGEAVRSMRRIAEIRGPEAGESCVDLQVLTLLCQAAIDAQPGTEPLRGTARMVDDLVQGCVRPLITREPRLWSLVAKLAVWRARYAEALEAHERAYRCLAVKTVERAYPVFQELVAAVRELVDAYESLGPMEGRLGGQVAPDWRFKARSVVRTLRARASNWADTEAYDALTQIMEDVKRTAAA